MRSGTPQYLFDTPRFLFARQQGGCFGRIGEICGGIGAGFCRRRGGRRRICRTGGRIGSGGGRGGFGGGGGFGRQRIAKLEQAPQEARRGGRQRIEHDGGGVHRASYLIGTAKTA